jgi:hypothetical protein
VTVAGQEDVLGLQVAMNDAPRVRGREPVSDLHGDFDRLPRG